MDLSGKSGSNRNRNYQSGKKNISLMFLVCYELGIYVVFERYLAYYVIGSVQ
jgi:hypothetical protein